MNEFTTLEQSQWLDQAVREYTVECNRCGGNGRVEMLDHCPDCEGSGRIHPYPNGLTDWRAAHHKVKCEKCGGGGLVHHTAGNHRCECPPCNACHGTGEVGSAWPSMVWNWLDYADGSRESALMYWKDDHKTLHYVHALTILDGLKVCEEVLGWNYTRGYHDEEGKWWAYRAIGHLGLDESYDTPEELLGAIMKERVK